MHWDTNQVLLKILVVKKVVVQERNTLMVFHGLGGQYHVAELANFHILWQAETTPFTPLNPVFRFTAVLED